MSIEKYLEKHNMARTPCRVELLKALSESDSALSELEIKEMLKEKYDRTTVYRTLKSFLTQNIIHSIALDGKEVRYALSHVHDHHHENHVHFYCTKCTGVYCLHHESLALPVLPEGFRQDSYDLLINGLCKHCNAI